MCVTNAASMLFVYIQCVDRLYAIYRQQGARCDNKGMAMCLMLTNNTFMKKEITSDHIKQPESERL